MIEVPSSTWYRAIIIVPQGTKYIADHVWLNPQHAHQEGQLLGVHELHQTAEHFTVELQVLSAVLHPYMLTLLMKEFPGISHTEIYKNSFSTPRVIETTPVENISTDAMADSAFFLSSSFALAPNLAQLIQAFELKFDQLHYVRTGKVFKPYNG